MVQVQARLLRGLQVERIRFVVGGSLGGMQTLEWGLLYPDWVERLIPIACSGRHSPWCIGLSEAQRQAIYVDPQWQQGNYDPENVYLQGLAVARMMAMNMYRSWGSFQERFGRDSEVESDPFSISRYLIHQGQKLVERFDANTYITLTLAMDRHDLARGRGTYPRALAQIQQPTLVVSIDSDVLYPPVEQEELVAGIPNAQIGRLQSLHGHDAFLIDMDPLNHLILSFLNA